MSDIKGNRLMKITRYHEDINVQSYTKGKVQKRANEKRCSRVRYVPPKDTLLLTSDHRICIILLRTHYMYIFNPCPQKKRIGIAADIDLKYVVVCCILTN